MDDNNRLRLNFQFDNQHQADAANARFYPTTPSTFPQPVYGQQTDQFGNLLSPNQTQQQSYFLNHPYTQQAQQYNQQYGGGQSCARERFEAAEASRW